MGSFFLLLDAGDVSYFFSLINSADDRVLSLATNADDKTLLFEIVFCIVWVGGAVIAVNGQLLGGTISFF